jgi:hypothetical protein
MPACSAAHRQGIELALPLPNVLREVKAMSPIESISIPEVSQAAPPLNCEERIRLAQLETLIQGSLEKFLLAGRALLEIKTRRLYRQEYSTFQDYCMKRWAISERRGLDLVRSTAVAENLLAGPAGMSGDAPLPPDLSENVMRPLAKLPPQLQGECWRLASRLTEKPTHFVVSRIVRVVSNAIDQGCGNTQKPKRVEGEECAFLRPVFRLAHIPFPDVQLFVSHFEDDSEQAAKAIGACRELEKRCQSICVALERRFPQIV